MSERLTSARSADKLPMFNANATCPKCGHADVSVHHCDGGRWCDHIPWDCVYEHHVRTCQCCRYQWAEQCLNSATVEAPTDAR